VIHLLFSWVYYVAFCYKFIAFALDSHINDVVGNARACGSQQRVAGVPQAITTL